MVDIVRLKARFACFPSVFVRGLVAYLHSLHLRETFYKISCVASLKQIRFEYFYGKG